VAVVVVSHKDDDVNVFSRYLKNDDYVNSFTKSRSLRKAQYCMVTVWYLKIKTTIYTGLEKKFLLRCCTEGLHKQPIYVTLRTTPGCINTPKSRRIYHAKRIGSSINGTKPVQPAWNIPT
jgi:hypothetical protein